MKRIQLSNGPADGTMVQVDEGFPAEILVDVWLGSSPYYLRPDGARVATAVVPRACIYRQIGPDSLIYSWQGMREL